ncbi:type II toxin-antitoxin system PemK/MazF family toxin [soil metagenome]|jgi:mRNA interferase MazF
MNLRRGDVVIVSAAGDFGKPRPAVVMQSRAMPDAHASVVLCQMTSLLIDAPDFRITIEPTPANGLRERSQVMADKPVTLMRSRIGSPIGRLSSDETTRIAAAIAFVIGLSD